MSNNSRAGNRCTSNYGRNLIFRRTETPSHSADVQVRNPLALLSTIVPKCFEGESFKAYREAEQQRQAEQEAETYKHEQEFAALLEAHKRVLDDPTHPPTIRH